MKVRISRKARSDLLGAFDYLADRNAAAAERLIADFDAKLRQLAEFPLIGRSRPEYAADLRSVLVRNHVVLYCVIEDEVISCA
ncbi:MAG TPA: type II toxin-antitoxin system RelE/ParE family toxin [Pseudolabrys sp.]|nr:type II toxin-antitoxin system RelE/ParE family toxin [Pseudolabrys sp.]